jgi:hypothetical protein
MPRLRERQAMGRIVILGCGPAGLAAAAAAVDSGHEAIIISNVDTPSTIHGCQYLHAPIPGYEDVAQVRVTYSLLGSPEEYRAKVYGGTWTGRVSPEDFAGDHDAWDIRETYRRLWRDLIESQKVGLIKSRRISHGIVPYVGSLQPDLLVSTIPAQALCQSTAHQFQSYTIYANGAVVASSHMPENEVICDGTSEHSWYRVSNVFGYRTTEWSTIPPHVYGAVPVVKPLWTDCNCHPWILRAGRYGAWEKARLVHEVYPAVKAALEPSDAAWVPGEGGSAWRM